MLPMSRWASCSPRVKRGPRPPVTASKEKRTYTPGQYDYYKAEWERDRNAPDFGKGNEWLTETPALEVAAQPFLATLDELGKLTQQTIFHELRDGIKSGWLINKGGNWAATHVLNACNPRVWDLCEESLKISERKREASASFSRRWQQRSRSSPAASRPHMHGFSSCFAHGRG